MESRESMSDERKAYIEEQIMSVLIELYEDQHGAKYTWERVETKDKTA